jgi:flavin reductase (DIM6/NTAB) family NADH-FMN oxidoreductase RutF
VDGSQPDAGVAWMLEQLWAPIVAVTAEHDSHANGLISSTVLTASLLPEAPRVAVQLGKTSLTRELVLGSGSLAVHLLPAEGERGLDLFRALGLRSGRDGAKLDEFPTRRGVTGSPILEDALAYVEARVADSLDTVEMTVVVADVVAGTRLGEGEFLTIEHVRKRLPPESLAEWERRYQEELRDLRRLRAASSAGNASRVD